jgi:AbiV family abortive infection protein
MPTKNRTYALTHDLLQAYRDAALLNAQALLQEATLLLANNHFARAYFLSASSIEEAGKAVQAFDGLGRNLRDPAVTQRLKLQFEDHSQKVAAAFSPWVLASSDMRAEVMDFVRTMVDVKYGREASMYTDINAERLIVTTPQIQVHKASAANCVRLASAVLSHVQAYLKQGKPKVTTRVQDAFFALRPSVFQKLANSADFWEYYIGRMERGETALETAVISYNDEYFSKGKLFISTLGESAQ